MAASKLEMHVSPSPYNSSLLSTALISLTMPLFDKIYRRVTNLIFSCLHCDSLFICSVVLYDIHVSRTNSPIGRNATFCSLRYDTSIDNLFDTKLSSRYCFARFQSALSIDLLARANALYSDEVLEAMALASRRLVQDTL